MHLTRCTSLDVLTLKGSARKNPSRSFREKNTEFYVGAATQESTTKLVTATDQRDPREIKSNKLVLRKEHSKASHTNISEQMFNPTTVMPNHSDIPRIFGSGGNVIGMLKTQQKAETSRTC